MFRPLLVSCLLWIGIIFSILFTTSSFAQDIPTVRTWQSVFTEVQKHPLFSSLAVSLKIPANSSQYSPLLVVPGPKNGPQDCQILIADNESPLLVNLLARVPSPEVAARLLFVMAAHELGHCVRAREKKLPWGMWALVAETEPGSAQRLALEKVSSVEEAYADAYALAYAQDTNSEPLYSALYVVMQGLRHSPELENPFYAVAPLYAEIERTGFNLSLPITARVEILMSSVKF